MTAVPATYLLVNILSRLLTTTSVPLHCVLLSLPDVQWVTVTSAVIKPGASTQRTPVRTHKARNDIWDLFQDLLGIICEMLYSKKQTNWILKQTKHKTWRILHHFSVFNPFEAHGLKTDFPSNVPPVGYSWSFHRHTDRTIGKRNNLNGRQKMLKLSQHCCQICRYSFLQRKIDDKTANKWFSNHTFQTSSCTFWC